MSATCAEQPRAADEAIAGTAPTALGWLCVEQPGAWGRDAAFSSGLDPAVAAHLTAGVEDLPVRLQLLRRPGRDVSPAPERTVLLAHAGATPWAERLRIRDVRDLLDLDPAVCAAATPPGLGEPVTDPPLLVCTHGRRDRCCATWGRPIADTLAALHPDRTWEVSHVGGHRFAGNLLVLPFGLVHGGLDVAGAVRVVDGLLADRLDLLTLRGRSGLSRPAQAAEVFARATSGVVGLHEVRVGAVEDVGDERHAVTVHLDGRHWRVEVARRPTGVPRLVSCDAADPEDPGAWHLEAITPA